MCTDIVLSYTVSRSRLQFFTQKRLFLAQNSENVVQKQLCWLFCFCLSVCFLHFNSRLEQDILLLDHVLHSFITSSVFQLSVMNQSKPLQSCSEQFLSGALQPSTPVQAGCGEITLEYLGGPNLIT